MKRIIGELRRRRVFRAAAACIVIAWLIVKEISTIGRDAGLPDWTPWGRMARSIPVIGSVHNEPVYQQLISGIEKKTKTFRQQFPSAP